MKSLAASVFEFLMNIYRFFQRPDKRKITIDRRDWFSKPPRSFKEFRTVKTEASGCTAYTLFANDHPDYHIIYFHGGAYIYKARVPHWYGIHYFLTHLSCAVTFVDYPLAPSFTCDTTVPAAVGIYHELVKVCDAPVTLMGDSAGAGLLLAVSQIIKKEGIRPVPEKLVLFSAWLDVATEVGISPVLKKQDKMLTVEGLRRAGRAYAGSRDVKDPLCSPIYGDLAGLPEAAIFSGTHDLIHADSVRLHRMLDEQNIAHTYYSYPEMQHAFMLAPMHEGTDALKKTCAFIQSPHMP